jgi:hypothetical protein
LGLSADLGRDPVLSLSSLDGAFCGDAFQDAPPQETGSRFLVNLRPCAAERDLPERFARAIFAFFAFSGASGSDHQGESGASGRRYVGVALAGEDERLMSDLIGRGCLPPMPIERIGSLEDAARVYGGASGAVGMRLHFAVLSVLARVPLAAVPYDPKVESFAEAYGVPLWRGGALPSPVLVDFPASAGEGACGGLDAFCRKGLSEW